MVEGAQEKSARSRSGDAEPRSDGSAKQRRSNRQGTGQGTVRRGERRRQLLAAAVKLFSERPYEDIFIDDIADEAGVAHGLLFYYFKDKHGIYVEALRQFSRDVQEYQRPRTAERTAEARLHGMVRRHFEYISRHPQAFVGFMRSGLLDPEVRQIFEAARGAGVELTLEVFGITSAPAPILRTALRGWVGFLDEITLDWLAHGDVPLDDIVQLANDALIAALRSVEGHHPDVTTMLGDLTPVA